MTEKYSPQDFKDVPKGFRQYYSTLGKCEWEIIAAHIITESKRAGKWVAVNEFPKDGKGTVYQSKIEMIFDLDIDGMIDAGKLEETSAGYELTERALEQIASQYLADK